MGIGMTGILQATQEQRDWLKHAYEVIREYDKYYSAKNGFPESIKLTTVKPSGSLSLLAGVTPGVHPNPAGPYYIRRVRMSADSNLLDVCKKNGYNIEYQRKFDGTNDHTTMVVEFPCKLPLETPVANNYSWYDQLEMVRTMQAEWSDNSVSCTVYYKREDLDDIKEYLKKYYTNNFKTLSFLLTNDHGFDQAPYETITEEKYLELSKNIQQITSVEILESDFEVTDCESGACPIK